MNYTTYSSLRTENKEQLFSVARSVNQLAKMTDEELAMAYADGESKAFDLLLGRNKAKLLSYIMFMVKDRGLADDIFQDTIVKVITRLRGRDYQPVGKFCAWMTRIAHNILMDYFRMQQKNCVVEMGVENNVERLEDLSVADENIGRYVQREYTLDAVKHMVDSLPAVQREVVYMRYFMEMPFKEIADKTGVSINTSLGRMHYAVINMRKIIKEQHLDIVM